MAAAVAEGLRRRKLGSGREGVADEAHAAPKTPEIKKPAKKKR
jgi:hypothetical protein